tara:strand:- start:172 stop:405 length:234 start_codon:yes stop_codon:yes gene_type:complete
MKFKVGQIFNVSFNINNSHTLSTAHFTGKTLMLNGEKVYLCELASGKRYVFTQALLDSFAPLNDDSLMETADSITMG